MSMKRNIVIDGQEVAFRASAAIPRIYRMRFHRDIFKDLKDLEKGIDQNNPENSSLDLFSLEMFENIAYVMAKHADPSICPIWLQCKRWRICYLRGRSRMGALYLF